jgi:hypothetical protein
MPDTPITDSRGDRDVAERRSHRRLATVLRIIGVLDLFALAVTVLPRTFIAGTHEWFGLGEFPAQPVVGYLSRSASLLYALHGALLIFLASDVVRYLPVIRFAGRLLIGCGLALLGIDLVEQMPVWWTLVEGPVIATVGVVIIRLA